MFILINSTCLEELLELRPPDMDNLSFMGVTGSVLATKAGWLHSNCLLSTVPGTFWLTSHICELFGRPLIGKGCKSTRKALKVY